MDLNKDISEGWTVGDFINELEPLFKMIQSGNSWQKAFENKEQVKKWCMENQPYYKKYIPEVVNYFCKQLKTK